MKINAETVRDLRDKTGAGMMDCKKALEESGGDLEKAIESLRKKGIAASVKREGRVASEGQVFAYVHPGGKIGVLIEVNCETDFVARTQEFQEFAKDIAMQIAAASPRYISRSQVQESEIEKEKEIYRAQAAGTGKPANVIEKIVEGRLEKFYAEVCLLEQPFVKDTAKSVDALLQDLKVRLRENLIIKRFTRYRLGEVSA